jgi:hypothetical protein
MVVVVCVVVKKKRKISIIVFFLVCEYDRKGESGKSKATKEVIEMV